MFFAALTYEDVFDLAKIEESMETAIGEFDEDAFNKWKNEYAHPLVVRRRRDQSQITRFIPVNNDSEIADINPNASQRGLADVRRADRNTSLFEMTQHPAPRNRTRVEAPSGDKREIVGLQVVDEKNENQGGA